MFLNLNRFLKYYPQINYLKQKKSLTLSCWIWSIFSLAKQILGGKSWYSSKSFCFSSIFSNKSSCFLIELEIKLHKHEYSYQVKKSLFTLCLSTIDSCIILLSMLGLYALKFCKDPRKIKVFLKVKLASAIE